MGFIPKFKSTRVPVFPNLQSSQGDAGSCMGLFSQVLFYLWCAKCGQKTNVAH